MDIKFGNEVEKMSLEYFAKSLQSLCLVMTTFTAKND